MALLSTDFTLPADLVAKPRKFTDTGYFNSGQAPLEQDSLFENDDFFIGSVNLNEVSADPAKPQQKD